MNTNSINTDIIISKIAELNSLLQKEKIQYDCFVAFSNKEIRAMNKKQRNYIRVEGNKIPYRTKTNGVHEIRRQINYKRIDVSSKSLADLKNKFLIALDHVLSIPECTYSNGNRSFNSLKAEKKAEEKSSAVTKNYVNDRSESVTRSKKNILLKDYMEKWLSSVVAVSVKKTTMKDYMMTFSTHIVPNFGNYPINEIKSIEIQEYINSLIDDGKNRTAKKICQLLNPLFKYAISDDIITHNPIERVRLPKYKIKKGIPLTRAEEGAFIKNFMEAPSSLYQQAYAFMIYTGIRRSEMASVSVSNGFVNVITAKQKKGLDGAQRSIPVSPMLEAVLHFIDVDAIKTLKVERLTAHFKNFFPNHHLHDTRHTFITRCQECEIPRPIVSVWSGHEDDKTQTAMTYTHLDQNKEYQKEQIKKYFYKYD